MFVHARIEQGINDKALLVPVRGVTPDPQGQASLLVVGPDGKVAQRTITTQGMAGTNWIVTAGLNPGERVIVAGIQKVKPGMLVQVTEAPQASTGIAKSNAAAAPAVPANTAMATQAK
jgi:membrane fusion protein (multidrug efflux system)